MQIMPARKALPWLAIRRTEKRELSFSWQVFSLIGLSIYKELKIWTSIKKWIPEKFHSTSVSGLPKGVGGTEESSEEAQHNRTHRGIYDTWFVSDIRIPLAKYFEFFVHLMWHKCFYITLLFS